MGKKIFTAHCSLIVITLLILGINTTAGTEQNNPTHNDTILRLGLHVSDMGNLEPHFAAGSQDRAFADMVFNGILPLSALEESPTPISVIMMPLILL